MSRARNRSGVTETAIALFLGVILTRGVGATVIPALQAVALRPTNSGALLMLRFGPQVPLYEIQRSTPTSFIIQIPETTVGASVPSHIVGTAIISSVDVRRVGRSLVVEFTTKRPATLNVTRLTTQLDVEVSVAGAVQQPAPSAYAAPSPEPISAPAASGLVTAVVPLKFADLKEVAQILTGQAIADTQAETASSMPTQSAFSNNANYAGGAFNPPPAVSTAPVAGLSALPPVSQPVNEHISIDRRLNALVLVDTPDEIRRYMDIIRQIDIPDASLSSITLETQIVELTESAARNIGIDFTNNTGQATASLHASAFNLPQSDLEIQAQLFAQIQKGNGQLIAQPRIQTLSGTPASILTGDALPILTTIVYPGVPPTIQQQLQYVNVGVQLQVQPFVTGSGYVTSRVVVEVSNVTGFITGNIPEISERQAVATARVHDGQPFVIGGLLQDNELRSMSKVPLLGDLPILGTLFRVQHTTMQKTNLYVVVTPHIVRSP